MSANTQLQRVVLIGFAFTALSSCRQTPQPPSPIDSSTEVTFCRDVAPLLFSSCSECHRPGEAAPFSLLTYRDAEKRIGQIVEVVESRFMPPWLPTPGYVEFEHDPSLTSEQIQVLRRWRELGCPLGDESELPDAPQWTEGWQLGEPDLVLSMTQPYDLASEGADVYRSFVSQIPIRNTRYVRAFEFRPGNPRVVHHANMSTDATPASRDRDLADEGFGFDGMALEAQGLQGLFNGWAPGIRPDPGRDGVAAVLNPGDDFVFQLHMTPSGRAEQVQAKVGLYFAKQPPSRHPVLLRLGSYALNIPPGERAHQVEDHYRLPIEVDVLGVNPHAHYLAKTIRAHAVTPEGDHHWLLRIDNWDFNWQGSYRYAKPMRLPRGTEVHVEFTYDNSNANPRNPHRPPQRVLYGPRTRDEMADLWLLVQPASESQRGELTADASLTELLRRIDGLSACVQHHPDPRVRAEAHDQLGAIFRVRGMMKDAERHFRAAIELDGDCLPARFHLGLLLEGQCRYAVAREQFETVVQKMPAHARSHFRLGRIAEAEHLPARASEHYRRALEHQPDLKAAQGGLARCQEK